MKLCLRGLSTDDNDDDLYNTRQTIHDCKDSLASIPDEPNIYLRFPFLALIHFFLFSCLFIYLLIYLGEKSHKCPMCSSAFAQKGTLKHRPYHPWQVVFRMKSAEFHEIRQISEFKWHRPPCPLCEVKFLAHLGYFPMSLCNHDS